MTGADMLLFEARTPLVIRDAHVRDERFPIDDDCQDWQLVNSTVDEGFLLLQVRRKLDTGDTQDWPIRNDSDLTIPTSRIIAAWGDDEIVSYHGPHNARGAIRWFRSDNEPESQLFHAQMDSQATAHFVLGAHNHSIQPIETEYAQFCFGYTDLVENMGVPLGSAAAGMTLIGFEPMVDNARYVHHFVLHASPQDTYSLMEPNSTNHRCATDGSFVGEEVAYVWAPGEPPFALPENVGFPLGNASTISNTNSGDRGYVSYRLENHYDNPNLVQGQVDSSGVKLYYSLESREHMAGYLMIGDPNIGLMGQEIGSGLTEYQFDCPSSCSQLALLDDGGENKNTTDDNETSVIVLREYLHMHQSGYSTSVEQWRNGNIVRTGRIDYFDFDQTGNPAVPQDPFEVQSGDAFRMRCYYQNAIGGRTFGLASSEEMCMAFLLYYPRKTLLGGAAPWMCGVGFADVGLAECDSNWTSTNVTTKGGGAEEDGVGAAGQTFGSRNESSGAACPLESEEPEGEGTTRTSRAHAVKATWWSVQGAAATTTLLVSLLNVMLGA